MLALVLSLAATAPVAQLSEQQLDANIAGMHKLPFSERIERLTQVFLGTPYGELPLGEGAAGGPEPMARWRVDKVDCQTFVETVLAMANARSLDEAKHVLDDIRYNGEPSFDNRNHFTEAQWLPVNVGKGYFTDEVPVLDGRAPTETLTLVHSQWSKVKVLQRLANIHNIPDGKYMVRYLPLDELRKHVKNIESGSIIMVVREHDPNRVVRISHMGFVIKLPKGWVVRHASTGPEHAVIEMPFGEYVKKQAEYKRWKVVGFALALPVDASLRVSQITKTASN
ncbi:MAG: N-acetylmuramoyl-L-alanine amidase-like domain-containing protein [Myxococcales bacterium]